MPLQTRRGIKCSLQAQKCADTYQRQGVKADAYLQAENRDDPAGTGRAEAGADDDADRLREGQQSGADEADYSQRSGTGGLHQGCGHSTGREGLARPSGKAHQRPAKRISGKRLQPVGQLDHSHQEETDAACKLEQENCHVHLIPAVCGRETFSPGLFLAGNHRGGVSRV